ncbi:hypothetical protein CCACVL1_23843 [Corchorus capsularis]|uniref:Uncharacterized protein n=1 Tax=Corchorus capsularis TaxID=210143 RepID=A0A1R3GRS4_COCAP|nr:hypothetical protein CCACVL1_23843 [Corchorus capsularis]
MPIANMQIQISLVSQARPGQVQLRPRDLTSPETPGEQCYGKRSKHLPHVRKEMVIATEQT